MAPPDGRDRLSRREENRAATDGRAYARRIYPVTTAGRSDMCRID